MARKGQKLTEEERLKSKIKLSPHQREVLIEEVVDLLLKFTPLVIIDRIIRTKYGISTRQVNEYVARAKAKITAARPDTEELIKERIAQGEALISAAIAAGDIRTAMTGYAALNRLGGLEKSVTEVHHFKAPQGITIDLVPPTPAELPPSEEPPVLPAAPPPTEIRVPGVSPDVSESSGSELSDDPG